jgi:hypothetical protein
MNNVFVIFHYRDESKMKEDEPKQLMISYIMVLRRTSCLLSKAENEYIIIAASPVFDV